MDFENVTLTKVVVVVVVVVCMCDRRHECIIYMI
jgi:hypothetical protein